MSRTRHAAVGSPLSQERWASSPAHEQGLKANLVARRCEVLKDAHMRELIWLVQLLSHLPGGHAAVVEEIRKYEPAQFGRTNADLLCEWLAEFCLNPAAATAPAFLRALRCFAAEHSRRHAAKVITSVGAAIHSTLEYSLEQRCLVVIEGVARIGKTFAAERWCYARAGRVRYVQCPSTNDDLAFFTAIARAIGLTVESNPKAKNLRPRIEDTLQGGDLMLVIDEGHYCWPGHSYRNARPARICWLLTALVNYNVPVAMVVTPQFFHAQKQCEEKIGWASAQLTGRIGDYLKLPDELPLDDLRAVARVHLPEGDAKSIEALALYAGSSQKYLAAIEHAVKKARYLAGCAGRREVIQSDVRTAIESSLMPSEGILTTATRTAREARANAPQPIRETFTGRMSGHSRVNLVADGGKNFINRTASVTATD